MGWIGRKRKRNRFISYEEFKEIRAVQEEIGLFFFGALENIGMKKKGILGAIVIALFCTGCIHNLNAVTTKEENNFQLPDVKSEISPVKCCICGNNKRNLIPYYRKSGMLGLVCLNTMEISTLDTRVYSDDGTEIISDGGRAMLPINFNNMLKNITNAYNKKETVQAKEERKLITDSKRKIKLLKKI